MNNLCWGKQDLCEWFFGLHLLKMKVQMNFSHTGTLHSSLVRIMNLWQSYLIYSRLMKVQTNLCTQTILINITAYSPASQSVPCLLVPAEWFDCNASCHWNLHKISAWHMAIQLEPSQKLWTLKQRIMKSTMIASSNLECVIGWYLKLVFMILKNTQLITVWNEEI